VRHHVEVDQSVKIEQTQGDTMLAFSDDIERAILVTAEVKRACQQELRAKGVKPGMIVLRMFAAGLLLLLESQMEGIAGVTIDTEYEGKEGEIKGLLLRFILKWIPSFPKEAIIFRGIGRRSRAHLLAWEIHKGRHQPDKRATLRELLQYC
jgi:hypothetical protein